MRIKSLKIDLIDYLFEIPYVVSQKDAIAIVDMINHPKLLSKQFWEIILGEDVNILYTLLSFNVDNEKVLSSIVNYYFTDKVLRKISLIPDYINYDKLVEGTVAGDMINSDVWRVHIQYLYDLRTVSRVTLNNHRISTVKLMNKVKKMRPNIDENTFKEKMGKLISKYPKVIADILLYVPQEKVINAGKKEFITALKKTKKDLHKKLVNFRFDSKLAMSNREAVYHVHEEMNYALEEFKIIEHIVDYITISSIISTSVYQPIYRVIVNLIAQLEKIEKQL